MAYRVRALRVEFVLLSLALLLVVGIGQAEAATNDVQSRDSQSFGVEPASIETEVGEVTEVSSSEAQGSDTIASSAFVQCNKQDVTMQYKDSADRPFIRFTGTKFWCFDGSSVLAGKYDPSRKPTMEVKTWIREDMRYSAGRDGYRYVPSGLKSTDKFLSPNGRWQGAHESVRIGRFEYRVRGFVKPTQVLMPRVERTAHYNGDCTGPSPTDVSPKVAAVRPAAGSKGVPVTANIEAIFSKKMKAGTLNPGTFYLVNRRTGAEVTAAIRYDSDKRKAILDPRRRLSPGVAYTATVFGGPYGAMTAEGDPLVADKSWSFTTKSGS